MSAPSVDPGPDPGAELLARVGDRVRRARAAKGLPRRVLSELSGVSPRYLAQLEAGAGNISIGLLHRVAIALDEPMEWLLGEEDPAVSEALWVADMYRRAPQAVQKRVMHILSPATMPDLRASRVCLVGLRGAGKSTLGARAGHRLDVPFVELNREIERDSGIPVEEVMALYGIEGYRKLESEAVDRVVAAHDRVILAVAGGIVSETDTYDRLLAHFHTVWLRATPEEHMARVRAQGDERPMAGDPAMAMDQLRAILKSREALYERALAQLDTSGKPLETSLTDLLALIDARGFLT
jgi:XRE family aerobic/anaerobic benzoate catabolism transcriptional regulator